ncbi:MAG: hypothetical protein HQK51_08815, partial [Oligoflexia bacterium]|nr:hypothetical protein [Oligoflexia bacterium]
MIPDGYKKKKSIKILLFIACLLLISFSVTSCDFLRQTKRKVKGVLLGVNHEEGNTTTATNNKGTTEDGDLGEGTNGGSGKPPTTTDGKIYDNSKLVEITDQRKIINLCNAFIQTPTTALKNILINDIREKAAGIFNLDTDNLNTELASCIYKLVPQLEQDQSVTEVIFEWYSVLAGKNKKIAAEALSRAFDFYPQSFMKTYFKK